jgi:peroxiredoxin
MNLKRSISRILLAGAFIAMFSGCGGAQTAGGDTAGDTTAAPADQGGDSSSGAEISDFSLKDVDGQTRSLSEFLGKYVIAISFWATWCEPCKKEMVQLNQLYEEYKDKGLMVISISMDEPETQGEVRPYIKQRGYNYPILLDSETQVTNQLNPRRAAPLTMIINRDGKVVWTHESYVPGDEKLVEEQILKALGESK